MGLGDLGVDGAVPKSGDGDASRDLLRELAGEMLRALTGVVALDSPLFSSASEPQKCSAIQVLCLQYPGGVQ